MGKKFGGKKNWWEHFFQEKVGGVKLAWKKFKEKKVDGEIIGDKKQETKVDQKRKPKHFYRLA